MGWKYYSRMIMPDSEPKSVVTLKKSEKRELFKKYKNALFIRYCKDFDLPHETDWWFCVKDDSYDYNSLNSKRRCYVRKSVNSFFVREMDPVDHIDEMHDLINDAVLGYESPVRLTYEQVVEKCKEISSRKSSTVYGAFDTNTQKCRGYLWVEQNGKCIMMIEQHCFREAEKQGCNAALVNYLCNLLNEKLSEGLYICDGERSVVHKTAFQDYLIKYFGFRRAYCRLVIDFNPKYSLIIKSLIALGGIFKHLILRISPSIYYRIDGIRTMYKISKGK